jgi:acyl carrier protein phosphodiesterase
VLKGIDLHRAIDNFTDTHEATADAKEVFRPHYRLYSGAFIDIVYDHFLAIDESRFPNGSLLSFSETVYQQLIPFVPQAPERFQQLFPHMQSQNWLFNYQFRTGIERSFRGMVHRAAYMNDSLTALQLFDTHYDHLHACYRRFFPDIYAYAREYLYNTPQTD